MSGLPAPTPAREQVLAALEAAQCGDILEKLPQTAGYRRSAPREPISPAARQQRIALARAILKDAPIVVLDEATAFADPENEALIQKAFATADQRPHRHHDRPPAVHRGGRG